MEVHLETQVATWWSLVDFPIKRNQRRIVSSPSEAFDPLADLLTVAQSVSLTLIKFRKFTLFYLYSGTHRTGTFQSREIISFHFPFGYLPIGIIPNPIFSDTSEIIPKPHCQIFFIKIMLKSPPECQACKFTLSSSCYRL